MFCLIGASLLFYTLRIHNGIGCLRLRCALGKVQYLTVDGFSRNPDERIRQLRESIISETYTPQPLIVFQKEKRDSTFRELTIPTISDKIVAKTAADFEVSKFNPMWEPQS